MQKRLGKRRARTGKVARLTPIADGRVPNGQGRKIPMNIAVSIPRTPCPYCARPFDWTKGRVVDQCLSCHRPLARVLVSRSPRLYRFFSLFELARVVTTVAGAACLLALVITGAPINGLALVIAVQLAIFGSADATDGILGLWTKVDKTARKVRIGRDARAAAVGKLVFGALTCAIGVIGFLVLKGAS